jgi:succinyl-CoA synthetase beta subunit
LVIIFLNITFYNYLLSNNGEICMPFLLEYEAKNIFEKEGIPCLKRKVASNAKEAREATDFLGTSVAIKAQIPTGHRGRFGGIRFASSGDEAERVAKEIIGKEIQGHKVEKVLVEEKIDILKELYLGVINDRAAKAPAVIVSSEGGMDVEEISAKFPEKIARSNVDVWMGLEIFKTRNLAKTAGVPSDAISRVSRVLYQLYRNVYRKYDAVYTEINPLCITKEGKLVATDARLFIDSNAMYRHSDIKPATWQRWNEREKFAHEKGFGYVELNTDGEIACIANGAGLGMTVMDYINEATKMGTLACFLDVGGRFYELAGEALRMVSTLPNLKAVLIHSYGGVTRQDILAESACKAIIELKPKFPVFIQISGTGEKGAIKVMQEWAPKLQKMGLTVEWTSHTATGKEGPSALKGGVDVIENPVKRVIEWSGFEYQRKAPTWLSAKPEWEAITRNLMKESLAQRPEEEYRELGKYE